MHMPDGSHVDTCVRLTTSAIGIRTQLHPTVVSEIECFGELGLRFGSCGSVEPRPPSCKLLEFTALVLPVVLRDHWREDQWR